MTAEILVMNKLGIALAADSTGTASFSPYGQKSFSINKLFMLSKYFPVGIMIYGQSSFFGIPWEIIIKEYRKHTLHDKKFSDLTEYGNDFIAHLTKNVNNITERSKEKYIELNIKSIFREIGEDAKASYFEEVQRSIDGSQNINFSLILENTITYHLDGLRKFNSVDNFKFTKNNFYKQFKESLDNLVEEFGEAFKEITLSTNIKNSLKEIAYFVTVKDTFKRRGNSSGIVIAGYGEDEIYPSMISYEVESIIIDDKLKYIVAEQMEVRDEKDRTAFVVPFAQEDTVRTFLTGISPAHEEIIEGLIQNILDQYPEKLIEKVENRLEPNEIESLKKELKAVGREFLNDLREEMKLWKKHNPKQILQSISILPITEIASIAEAIVNLTSVRRRMSPSIESVGGEVDVALITKGDGFIWIRRKIYFEPSKNIHYLAKYKGDFHGK